MLLIDTYLDKSKIHGIGVFSNQNIGEVFTNKSSGKSSVQFSVFDKTTPVNPQLWLLKK